MNTTDKLHKGRPFCGIAILWHTSISLMCNILPFDDPRLMGIEVNCDAKKILLLNVYLPYDNGDNCDDYMYYLAMINSVTNLGVIWLDSHNFLL